MNDQDIAVPSNSVAGGGRADFVGAAAVGAVGCLAFLSTFSGHVALGDAPESVSGIKTLGVLHAPGYPTYVAVSRVFADIFAVGSWALRVNLFSLVCATLTVSVLFLLARGFGASITGAVAGALAFSFSASFWFNAGFAKHYAVSSLLLAASALLVVYWQQRPRTILLVLAAALLGACTGAAWQLAMIMAIGLVALIALGPVKPHLTAFLASAAAMVVFAAAGLVFMVLRARRNPPINWGNVTRPSRLVAQITQADFRGDKDFTAPAHPGAIIPRVGTRTVSYLGIIIRDLGIAAAILAVAGIVAAYFCYRHTRRDQPVFLAVVAVVSLGAIIVVPTFEAAAGLDLDHISGFFTGIALGGFLIDTFIVVAILVALGTTYLSEELSKWIARQSAPPPPRSRSRSQTRGRARARSQPVESASGLVTTGLAVVMAALVVVPSLLVHYRYANHRIPAFADHYGHRVLASLPRQAVLIVGGYEFGQPMVYRQVVLGERTDVTVVYDDLMVDPWYREELAKSLGFDTGRTGTPSKSDMDARIRALRGKRPVFIDTSSMSLARDRFGYRAHGLVGEVVAGTPGPHPDAAAALDAASRELRRDDAEDRLAKGRYNRFPNQWLYFFHQRAHVELAQQYSMNSNDKAAVAELQRALALSSRPDEPSTLAVIEMLKRHDPRAAQAILGL